MCVGVCGMVWVGVGWCGCVWVCLCVWVCVRETEKERDKTDSIVAYKSGAPLALTVNIRLG